MTHPRVPEREPLESLVDAHHQSQRAVARAALLACSARTPQGPGEGGDQLRLAQSATPSTGQELVGAEGGRAEAMEKPGMTHQAREGKGPRGSPCPPSSIPSTHPKGRHQEVARHPAS